MRVTEECHERLTEAARLRFGTEHIRWSDVIQALCEEEIARLRGGDD